jgi:hypothetical protein
MNRVLQPGLKWLLPLLIAVEIVLAIGGVVRPQVAAEIALGVESLLLLVGGWQVARAVRRYRQDRAAGLEVWAAVEEGMAVFVPRKVARLLVLEPQLWMCLLLWIFRRRRPTASDFSYHKNSIFGVMLIACFFSAPIEILLFELLIPWPWLRLMLLIASLYTLFWVLGYYAALVVRPHRLEDERLRLRFGLFADERLPYVALDRLAREQRTVKKRQGLSLSADQTTAFLSMDGKTDVTLHLVTPQRLRGASSVPAPVTTFCVAVDDSKRFVEALRQKMEMRTEEARSEAAVLAKLSF